MHGRCGGVLVHDHGGPGRPGPPEIIDAEPVIDRHTEGIGIGQVVSVEADPGADGHDRFGHDVDPATGAHEPGPVRHRRIDEQLRRPPSGLPGLGDGQAAGDVAHPLAGTTTGPHQEGAEGGGVRRRWSLRRRGGRG